MLTKQSKETSYNDFICLLKEQPRGIYASPSHNQTSPCAISSFAILKFQYDGEIFSNSTTGFRIVISHTMPAFNLYDVNFELTI